MTFSSQRAIAHQARLRSSNGGNNRYCSCSATSTADFVYMTCNVYVTIRTNRTIPL